MRDDSDDSSEKPELDLPEAEETFDDEEDLELDEWWSWGNFARLFIFPLIIVAVAVLIWGTVEFLVGDSRSINDHISRIQSGTQNQRWRAAYSLAQEVKRQELQKQLTRDSALDIIDLYRRAREARIKKYLALVLAEIPIDETLGTLRTGLDSQKDDVVVNTILALGRLHENAREDAFKSKVTQVAPEIATFLSHDNPEVRRMAAFVLGSLNNKAVVEDLHQTLNDNVPDVRWNGAIALAQLGSDSGERVLIKVLEDASKGKFRDKEDMDPRLRRNLLINAIQALGRLNSRKAVPILKTLKESDRDSKIRKNALKALNKIQSS